MKLFLIIPFAAEFEDIRLSITEAANSAGYTIVRADDVSPSRHISIQIQEEIQSSDVIVADLSFNNPNVMFEFGWAQASGKPIIAISQKDELIPFDIAHFQVLRYDRFRLTDTLVKPLSKYLLPSNRQQLTIESQIVSRRSTIKKVFISYSHVDTQYLNRLRVHMRPFEKNGQIDLWVDTKIKAGEKWKERIDAALSESSIAILLISADFLASDFIVDNELPPLLKAAEEKGKLILPVILKPCRFIKDSNLSQFQAVNDPTMPLSRMDENEREEIYVRIADYIESMINS